MRGELDSAELSSGTGMAFEPYNALGVRTIMAQQSRTITADELWCMPDDGYHRYELDRGRLLTMAPAGTLHGAVTFRLGAALVNYVDASRAGVVLGGESGFKLESDPDTVLAPDVAFIARDRIPVGGLPVRFWTGAPDLAVEVLSPSDRRSEVNRKIARYLRLGVKQVWFVEPTARRITVHKPEKTPVVLLEADTLDGGDLLPGFQYQLSRLFNFDF